MTIALLFLCPLVIAMSPQEHRPPTRKLSQFDCSSLNKPFDDIFGNGAGCQNMDDLKSIFEKFVKSSPRCPAIFYKKGHSDLTVLHWAAYCKRVDLAQHILNHTNSSILDVLSGYGTPMQMANQTRDGGIISLLSRARKTMLRNERASNTDMTSTQLSTDKRTETSKVT